MTAAWTRARRYGWRAPVELAARLAFAARCARNRLLLRTLYDVELGESVIVEDEVELTRGCRVRIEDACFLGRRSSFTLQPQQAGEFSLTIGARSWISRDAVVAAASPLWIGSDVLIGEFVSIRDSQHRFDDRTRTIRSQGDVIGSIRIEDDVWIGRGTLVLGRPGGIVLGRGSIVGANSVVSCDVPPYTIWAGAPARMLRER